MNHTHYSKILSAHESSNKPHMLIVAPPRSGTGYVSRALSHASTQRDPKSPPFTHERIFSIEFVTNNDSANIRSLMDNLVLPVREVSWLALPAITNNCFDSAKWTIVHLARNPYLTAQSIARRGFLYPGPLDDSRYADFAKRMMPPGNLTSMVGSATRLVLTWHNTIGHTQSNLDWKPDYFMRLEDFTMEFEHDHGPMYVPTNYNANHDAYRYPGVNIQGPTHLRPHHYIPMRELCIRLGYNHDDGSAL